MVNISRMDWIVIVGYYFQDKVYAQGCFSEGEHKGGFQLIEDVLSLESCWGNKNLWVKDEEI